MADVEVTREDSVLTITLNRPEVLNALNGSVHRGLFAALETARAPGVRAVVITGAGRGFCVGQDLQEFSGPPMSPTIFAATTTATCSRSVRSRSP